MGKKKKQLYIGFVLDETGSMDLCKLSTISGFNEYLQQRQREDPEGLFTLTVFNASNTREVCNMAKIRDVLPLTPESYQPNSLTPLYDAIGRGIRIAESASKSGDPVLIVIQTDGEENASHEFTRQAIFDLVEQKKKDGWTFLFMGTDIDAYATGASIGVPKGNTMNYASADSVAAFRTASRATSRYSAGGGVQQNQLFDDQSSGKTPHRMR